MKELMRQYDSLVRESEEGHSQASGCRPELDATGMTGLKGGLHRFRAGDAFVSQPVEQQRSIVAVELRRMKAVREMKSDF